MNIVVLDGYALNPGDLNWDALNALGRVTVYDRTPLDQIVERSRDAEVILTNKTPLNRTTIEQLVDLRYIGVLATGHNVVDSIAAKENAIRVTNVPGYGTMSVAQQCLALLLEISNATGSYDASVHRGEWVRSLDYSYCVSPIAELAGKTVGIIGYGEIGRAFANCCRALGMNAIALERAGRTFDVPAVSLTELAENSDVVSLHCPLTAETIGIVDEVFLSRMKATAILLNTSRGPLIDESALAHALNSGMIAAAGLDVLSVEPPTEENPLLTAKNCVITPHVAWASYAARARLLDIAVENLRSFLRGEFANVIA